MESYLITIEPTGEQFRCREDRSVLVGMEQLGNRGIPVGCRGGGCGVCKIKIIEGTATRKRMSRAHVSADDEANGIVLACRVFPTSDMSVVVVERAPESTSAEEAAA